MKRCTKCILPETFPSIKFDDNGVCNYCRNYKGQAKEDDLKTQYQQKFESLLSQVISGPNSRIPTPDNLSSAPDSSSPVPDPLVPTPGSLHPAPYPYHVLMAFSGGKDSSYTLDVFKNKYNLSVLAVTFDHGFLSPYALENIKAVCESLSIDHITFKPQFDILTKIFKASVNDNFYSNKALERASTICSSCMGIVKFITLKLALEKRIPFIGYGWSPGQAPVQSSVMKINADFMHSSQKSFYEPLHKIAGDTINKYFLTEADFQSLKDLSLYNVHPLAFLEYSEERIYQRIAELGWLQPLDTDSNSSNCL